MPTLTDRGPIIDGLSYQLMTPMLPNRYLPAVMGQLETIRKAGAYRSRWYVCPEDSRQVIAGYDTVEQQVRIVPGSWLYGLMFSQAAPPGSQEPGAYVAPSNLTLKLSEGSTGIGFSDDYVGALAFAGGAVQYRWPGRPYLLSQPRLIVDPGFLNVEISNLLPTATGRVQLVLLCAEPCVVIEDSVQSSECNS